MVDYPRIMDELLSHRDKALKVSVDGVPQAKAIRGYLQFATREQHLKAKTRTVRNGSGLEMYIWLEGRA